MLSRISTLGHSFKCIEASNLLAPIVYKISLYYLFGDFSQQFSFKIIQNKSIMSEHDVEMLSFSCPLLWLVFLHLSFVLKPKCLFSSLYNLSYHHLSPSSLRPAGPSFSSATFRSHCHEARYYKQKLLQKLS